MKKDLTIILKGIEATAGDIFMLLKEPHPQDHDAIKVLDSAGLDIGYVANSPNTVHEGTISATMLKDEFPDKARIVVGEEISKKGPFVRYLATLLLEKKKDNDVLEFNITGTSAYPGKTALINAVKASGNVNVKLTVVEDRIVALHEGKEAGIVKADEDTHSKLFQHIEDTPEVFANCTGLDRGKVLATTTISLQQEIKVKRVKIEDSISRILAAGIDTEENLNEKIEYLRRNKVTEVSIASLLESYEEYPHDVKVRIPEKPETLFVDTTDLVKRSVAFMNIQKNLRFEGEKGVGKNVLTETLCWLYNRPMFEFSMNGGHSNNALLGGKTFEEGKEVNDEEKSNIFTGMLTAATLLKKSFFKGKVDAPEDELKHAKEAFFKAMGIKDKALVFEMSSILEAAYHGGVVVLDEFNMGIPNALAIFNSLLDARRRMEVPGYKEIRAHKNFLAISTLNMNYEGTFEENSATKDRFVTVPFPELSAITPILTEKVKTITYDTAVSANRIYLGLRDSVKAGTLSQDALSIRAFIDACEVMSQGFSLKEALTMTVVTAITDTEERMAVQEIIDLQLI